MSINRNLKLFRPICPFGLSEIDSHFATVFQLNRGSYRFSLQYLFEKNIFRLVVEKGNEGGADEVYNSLLSQDEEVHNIINDSQIHEADDYQTVILSAFLKVLYSVEQIIYQDR